MTTRLFCPRRWLWTAPHGDIPILPTLCGPHPRTRFFLGALLLVFMSLGQAVRALPVPPIQRPVRDEVRLLDMAAAAQVRQICNDLERRTDAELVVLIIRSTKGENHHEFALKTFNSWGVGSGERHDGVLILFAIDDRRVEIVPGRRYQHLFTQQASTDLLTTHVVPLMRAGKMADGVIAATRQVADMVTRFENRAEHAPGGAFSHGSTHSPSSSPAPGRAAPAPAVAPSGGSAAGTRTSFLIARGVFGVFLLGWIGLGCLYFHSAFTRGELMMPKVTMSLLLILGAVGLIFFATRVFNLAIHGIDQMLSFFGGSFGAAFLYFGSHMCPRCNKWMSVHNRTLRHATYSSSGLGERTEDCSHCGHHQVSTYTISRKTRSSSSSSRSSSSRGGRSSGGGGGASW
jgi:uncharacterized protein